ncbi:alpha/beta hydrolase family protein [Legionella waltersii]|uniref:Acylaminoacyl peptidase n=1 Tax=Legionella waltersii TaxID=66969 RepID=A0A0W1A1X5_9GAMM|nr:S9 family peptidase [Legionella waltersii]KTD75136.1 acylaminoacyl peptidase [Legionella waltersii]SNV04878.1 acylaminoacyl peptidase [Legionella waltersii]
MSRIIIALLMIFIACDEPSAAKRLVQLRDLYQIQYLSEPEISPDGKWASYTVSRYTERNNSSISEIWRVTLDGKISEPLMFSKDADYSMAKWSPDGRWLAYLSDAGEDGTNQLWLLSTDTNTPQQLTYFNGEVTDYSWAPDSHQIAFVAQESSNSYNEPIVVDQFQFKIDGIGYLHQKLQKLYIIRLTDKEITQLTNGDHDEYLPAWSPDGKYIAYVSRRGKDADRHFNDDIFLIEPHKTAEEKQLTHFLGSDMNPDYDSKLSWSPDSKNLAYIRSNEHQWIYYSPTQLATINIDTGKESIPVPIDKWVFKPTWSKDGSSIYVLIEESRNTYLNQVNPSTGQIKKLTSGLRVDSEYSLNQNKLVVLTSDDTHPSELYSVSPLFKQITFQNKELLETVQFKEVEDIEFKSTDGTVIQGLLIKPEEYIAGKPVSGFIFLHGGPVWQFSHEFNFETQWLAANGYAVIEPNPRGSSGRGFQFSKAIFADWGNLDVKDILAAADYAVSIGVVDPNRLGVGGWSYGGILTDYVIASDNRFKAAISGAGNANFLSSYGVDQYSPEYELELGKPWKNKDLYFKLSYPFFNADKIKTPTLFLCGQLDVNVPCAGSEQLYQALKSLNIPAELVIYPNEYHTIEKPSFIIDKLRRYAIWLEKYLH